MGGGGYGGWRAGGGRVYVGVASIDGQESAVHTQGS
jgi:hypothetical protein